MAAPVARRRHANSPAFGREGHRRSVSTNDVAP